MSIHDKLNKLNIDGRLYICYDYILPISDTRLLATHGREISLITIDGRIICTYDSIYPPTFPAEVYFDENENVYKYREDDMEDILIFVDNGKKGVIDYDGGIILDAEYREISFNANLEAEVLP